MGKRDLMLNNLVWKIIALILAVGTWFAFRTQENSPVIAQPIGGALSTRELVSHPITITKPASDTREFKVTPAEVDITLGGADWNKLKKLDGMGIQATVDLSNLKGTNGAIPIKVYLPPGSGVTLERLIPDRVQVELIRE